MDGLCSRQHELPAQPLEAISLPAYEHISDDAKEKAIDSAAAELGL
jgi:hypothetical protein